MALLFGSAIVAMCASAATQQYSESCNKAIDAGTRQIGLREDVDRTEDRTIQYVNTVIQSNLTQEEKSGIAVAGFVYKTTKDKKLSFKLPNTSLYDSATNEISPESYVLNIRWNF